MGSKRGTPPILENSHLEACKACRSPAVMYEIGLEVPTAPSKQLRGQHLKQEVLVKCFDIEISAVGQFGMLQTSRE